MIYEYTRLIPHFHEFYCQMTYWLTDTKCLSFLLAYFYILRFLYTSKAILSVILPICENLSECWFAYRVMHAYYKTLRTQFILCCFWGSWNRAIPFMFGLLHSFDFLFDWSDFSIVNYLLFQNLHLTSNTFIFLIFIPRMVTQKVLIRCRNSVVFANWQKYLFWDMFLFFLSW